MRKRTVTIVDELICHCCGQDKKFEELAPCSSCEREVCGYCVPGPDPDARCQDCVDEG